MAHLLLILALFTGAAQATDGTLPSSTDEASTHGPATETVHWAGTLAVLGNKKIPLLGKVEFRTDTHVIATATRNGDIGWTVTQNTCSVSFSKTMGAEVTLDNEAPSSMPSNTFDWVVDGDGNWSANWKSGWDDSDHDNDGHPGISFNVKAPFCGGSLYMGSAADQTATGRPTKERVVEGPFKIWVEQRILGTRGRCLNLMTRDESQWMAGRFAFVEVPSDASCDSIEPKIWPDPMSRPE